MELIVNRGHELDMLVAIKPDIEHAIARHLRLRESRGQWQPIDLIAPDVKVPEISPELKASLIMNLLTEEGLPYFLGLLAKHLGESHPIWQWIGIWTGEEDRHGAALARYLDLALSQTERRNTEVMQQRFLEIGFWPNWQNSLVWLICYVVIQEKATQISHGNIGGLAAEQDETLQKMMGCISFEEKLHHQVYLAFLKALYQLDQSYVIWSLLSVAETFVMPGESMPEFKNIAAIQRQLNIFGPGQLASILKKVWNDLEIGSARALKPAAEQAREAYAKRIVRLRKMADRFSTRRQTKIDVSFLDAKVVEV